MALPANIKKLVYQVGDSQQDAIVKYAERNRNGDLISSVSVSSSGTSVNDANYITVDGTEWHIGSEGGQTLWGNIGGTLANQTDLSIALSGKEDATNKITSITSSSTDAQYPSAKCIYDNYLAKAGGTMTGTLTVPQVTFATTKNIYSSGYDLVIQNGAGDIDLAPDGIVKIGGQEVATKNDITTVSGTSSGNNWSTITIGSTTKNIPSSNALPTTGGTMTGALNMSDNVKITFDGTGDNAIWYDDNRGELRAMVGDGDEIALDNEALYVGSLKSHSNADLNIEAVGTTSSNVNINALSRVNVEAQAVTIESTNGDVSITTDGNLKYNNVNVATVNTVTGVKSGNNWTAITINGTSGAIPQGGGGSTLYMHDVILSTTDVYTVYLQFISSDSTEIVSFNDIFNNREKMLRNCVVHDSDLEEYMFGMVPIVWSSAFNLYYFGIEGSGGNIFEVNIGGISSMTDNVSEL